MRRPIAVVVLAAALVGLSLPPAGAAEAVNPSNRPTPIEGRENGRLESRDLITVANGCSVARAAGPSLHRLFLTARITGAALGTRDCYRPIDEQVAVGQAWTDRGNSACAAQPRFDANGRPIGTSMHGWGKAVDFADGARSMTFSSAGYGFLKRHAATMGWNHPGWAEPGGSACPEAWHWEWVGDGGTQGATPVRADVVGLMPAAGGLGYATVTGLGDVIERGAFIDRGNAASLELRWVVIGAASTAVGRGYWLVGADGGVFTFGDAAFHGSTGGTRLNAPIVGMAPTPSGRGYWLVGADGGVFTFGDAAFHGSTGGLRLNAPIVAMAATRSGAGYWLVGADGGIFTFGDAAFHGSAGGVDLVEPVVAATPTPSGNGYWLTATDGGIFTFGDAAFHGSAGGVDMVAPVVAMAASPAGDGYWLAAADGGVFTFGNARFFGAG